MQPDYRFFLVLARPQPSARVRSDLHHHRVKTSVHAICPHPPPLSPHSRLRATCLRGICALGFCLRARATGTDRGCGTQRLLPASSTSVRLVALSIGSLISLSLSLSLWSLLRAACGALRLVSLSSSRLALALMAIRLSRLNHQDLLSGTPAATASPPSHATSSALTARQTAHPG